MSDLKCDKCTERFSGLLAEERHDAPSEIRVYRSNGVTTPRADEIPNSRRINFKS